MLNFFGNIARAVPRGYRAAAAEAPAGTPEVAAAGAPPARVPAAMPWPENLMDCAVLSVKYRGLCRGERQRRSTLINAMLGTQRGGAGNTHSCTQDAPQCLSTL